MLKAWSLRKGGEPIPRSLLSAREGGCRLLNAGTKVAGWRRCRYSETPLCEQTHVAVFDGASHDGKNVRARGQLIRADRSAQTTRVGDTDSSHHIGPLKEGRR